MRPRASTPSAGAMPSLRFLELDDPAARDPGRVDDAVDGSEALARLRDDPLHVFAASDVGGHVEHLPTPRIEVADLANALARRVPLVVRRKPRILFRAVRDRRAAGEDQPGLPALGQVARDGEADPAEAASDEVDAALAERCE